MLMTFSNPLLGFLAGAAFTAVIQSSAAFNQYYDEYRKTRSEAKQTQKTHTRRVCVFHF